MNNAGYGTTSDRGPEGLIVDDCTSAGGGGKGNPWPALRVSTGAEISAACRHSVLMCLVTPRYTPCMNDERTCVDEITTIARLGLDQDR